MAVRVGEFLLSLSLRLGQIASKAPPPYLLSEPSLHHSFVPQLLTPQNQGLWRPDARGRSVVIVYEAIKPGSGGGVNLLLTPLELIERLAALIPPPRRHRHRYYGVLAPNAPLRVQVRFRRNSSRPSNQILDHLTVCSWPVG